jgi:tetratricopeptide (TPR) repeat protein
MKFNLIFFCSILAIGLMPFFSCQNDVKDTNVKQDTTQAPVDTLLESINSRISADPNNAALLHERAKLFLDRKMLKEALADMEVVIKLDSTKSEYFVTMADLSYFQNRTNDARTFLQRAVRIDPENTAASLKLAEFNYIFRRYGESLDILNSILKKDDSNTQAWLMRGYIFKENGDTNQAVSDFQSALEANPEFYDANMQLGMIFQLRNNPICVGYFTNALMARPASEEAYYGRGLWYQEKGQFNQAIQDYSAILKINPKNKTAHFNLGYIHLVYLKVYPEAVKHFTRAIESDTTYAEAYFNRAMSYERLGNIVAAQSDFQSALTHRPGYRLAEEGLRRVSK